MTTPTRGILAGILAFSLWGILPLYWMQLHHLNPLTIVAQRTCWTSLFLWALILHRRIHLSLAWPTLKWQLISGTLIGGNWLLYVWSTLNQRMIEGALGYYINPFFNMLFGAIWFGEKHNRLQQLAIITAFIGVLIQIPGVGHFPWVALTLGLTFSLYGVVRKHSTQSALQGLTIETTLLAPLALAYLILANPSIPSAFGNTPASALWLIGAGLVTAIPLLLFGFASRNIRLSTLGMLQFIGPTTQFFIGWLLYHEPMTTLRLASFALIWLAIAIYAADSLHRELKTRKTIHQAELAQHPPQR